ncbi:MAG: hypothetical protein POELPBGB_01247 [Bacteroidia bacterium]|nr:hypothetical protein [Bacteroidia bacterium]
MKVIRWILFLPVFLLVDALVGSLCRYGLLLIYGKAFPINGIFDYLLAGAVWLPLSIIVVMFYGSSIMMATLIAPHQKIGAWICFAAYVSSWAWTIIKSPLEKHDTVLLIIFASVTSLLLITTGIVGKGSTKKQIEDENVLDLPQ